MWKKYRGEWNIYDWGKLDSKFQLSIQKESVCGLYDYKEFTLGFTIKSPCEITEK
jgi:hypothetical protein